MSSPFTYRQALSSGYSTTQAHLPYLIKLSLFLAFFGILATVPSIVFTEFPFSILAIIFSQVIKILLVIGTLTIILSVAQGQEVSLSNFFNRSQHFWSMLIVTFAYVVIVLVGVFFLIIPGLLLAIRYIFVSWLVADQGLGPIEAFKYSARLTAGHYLELAKLLITGAFLRLLPLIPLIFSWLYLGYGLATNNLTALMSLMTNPWLWLLFIIEFLIAVVGSFMAYWTASYASALAYQSLRQASLPESVSETQIRAV